MVMALADTLSWVASVAMKAVCTAPANWVVFRPTSVSVAATVTVAAGLGDGGGGRGGGDETVAGGGDGGGGEEAVALMPLQVLFVQLLLNVATPALPLK